MGLLSLNGIDGYIWVGAAYPADSEQCQQCAWVMRLFQPHPEYPYHVVTETPDDFDELTAWANEHLHDNSYIHFLIWKMNHDGGPYLRGHNQKHAFAFSNVEDAVIFKLRWQ